MKAFAAIVFALMSLLAFASPEDMYGQYDKDGKYRAMQEQMDKINQQAEAAEKERAEKQTMALWAALLTGLIPLGYIGSQVIREQTWKSNPRGTAQALAVGLAGGAVLFGLNYGVFLLKIEYGSKFNTAVAMGLVLFMIIGSIYVLKKTK